MIKLEDMIDASVDELCIMNGHSAKIRINPNHDISGALSDSFIKKEVEKFDTYDGMIRVWLNDKEESND